MNALGKQLTDRMTVLERYWQKSDEIYSSSTKMSYLTVVNTGFIILYIDQ